METDVHWRAFEAMAQNRKIKVNVFSAKMRERFNGGLAVIWRKPRIRNGKIGVQWLGRTEKFWYPIDPDTVQDGEACIVMPVRSPILR